VESASQGNGSSPVSSDIVELEVNGEHRLLTVQARETLAEVLRYRLKLTGTKLGCNRAECGTCTVIIDGETALACSVLALEATGRRIETIEGISEGSATKLHPLQESFINEDALQCGYCIPGMIMSCKNLLDHNPSPTANDVKRAVEGNYCRCGAYPNIISATLKAASMMRELKRVVP